MPSPALLNPSQLTVEETAVLDFVRVHDGVSNREVMAMLEPRFGALHRNTIGNYLNSLLEKGLIKKEGAGGHDVRYVENIPHLGYRFFDVAKYFETEADNRALRSESFSQDVFELMKDTFTDQELKTVAALNENYTATQKAYSPQQIRRELERFTIELAWKSSRIEGNTYSLIDTEILLKKHQEAKGHDRLEAVEIYNHKKAIDYILENRETFRTVSVKKIVELHTLLTDGLDIDQGIRNGGVGIVGTKYRPLGNRVEIDAAMRNLVDLINGLEEPVEKAFAAVMLVSYIQPFFDGNKRTSRILGNALLLAHGLAPLSYRSVDEAGYKKGIILFYEQSSFRYFKELFVEQFKFSIENYFSMGR